jgi:hypothetical protein
MFNDIKINKLLIMFLFMFPDFLTRPKFISKFTNNFQIFKWIILFLMTMKRKNGLTLFPIILIFYNLMYLLDKSIFRHDLIKPNVHTSKLSSSVQL